MMIDAYENLYFVKECKLLSMFIVGLGIVRANI